LNNSTGLYLDEINQILYITNEDSHSVTQWIIGDYENRNIYAGIPGRSGNSSAQLFNPQGLTMDKHGNLYVADVSNSRIQMFCPDAVFGITIAGTGRSGSAVDQLHFPYDLAFDFGMHLYVSDTWNNRIQRFNRIQ
jgi:sugar lactone lactonase YvrE